MKLRDCDIDLIWSCTKLTTIAVRWGAVFIKITTNWITQMKGSLSIFASDFLGYYWNQLKFDLTLFSKLLLFYDTVSLLVTVKRKTFNASDSCWCICFCNIIFAKGDTPILLQQYLAPVSVYRRVKFWMVITVLLSATKTEAI